MAIFKVEAFKDKEKAKERITFLKQHKTAMNINKEPKEPRFYEDESEWLVIYSIDL